MSMVTISSRGTIRLSREILEHLEVSPGRTVELLKMPDGQITINRPAINMSVDQFVRHLIYAEPDDETEDINRAETGKSTKAG